MIKKKYVILALVLSLVLGFTCLNAYAQQKKILAVGSPQDSKNLFWKYWLAGFEDAGKQLGLEIAVVDGQGKEDVQLRGVEDAIVKGAKILLRAANKKYPPIEPKAELVIGGVVIANVRKYK